MDNFLSTDSQSIDLDVSHSPRSITNLRIQPDRFQPKMHRPRFLQSLFPHTDTLAPSNDASAVRCSGFGTNPSYFRLTR